MNLENYRAYAFSETEAKAIVAQVNSDNNTELVSFKVANYAPKIWGITIDHTKVTA